MVLYYLSCLDARSYSRCSRCRKFSHSFGVGEAGEGTDGREAKDCVDLFYPLFPALLLKNRTKQNKIPNKKTNSRKQL